MLGRALLILLALTAAQAPPAADGCVDELARFRAALGRARAGDGDALATLRTGAETLCADCGRCDARAVASFYMGLAADARAAGLAREERVQALRVQVQSAAESGLPSADWRALRESILDELAALADASANEPDFTPAAHAHSLAARLLVERLEGDRSLAPSERAALAGRAGAEARASLALFERAGLVTPRLEPAWLLARLERLAGDPEAARAGFRACLADAEAVRRDDYRENALRGLLDLARDGGDVVAQERLLLALAAAKSPDRSWPVARDWSVWLMQADHGAEALDFLERHAPSADAPAERTEWDLLMGGVLLRMGRTAAARTHFERLATDEGGETAVLALAQLALREEKPYETLALLSDDDALAGFGALGRAEALQLRGAAHLAQDEPGEAAAELARALALADSWDAHVAADPLLGPAERAVRNVIGEWLGVHAVALYADALARSGRPLEAATAIEEYQSRSLRRGEGELGRLRELAGYPGGVAALLPSDVSAWARSSELGLVTWAIGPDFGVVAHVDRDGGAACARIDIGRTAIEDAARRLREAAIAGDDAACAALGAEIGAALLPPAIRSRLPRTASPDARLLLLLHGALEALPIELVRVDGAELGARLTPVCLPGLPAAAPGTRPAARPAWSLCGAPSGTGMAELPSARAELAELAGRAGVAAAVGADCDRAHLVAALASGGAVHVATHLARADGDGGRFQQAGFLLAGGEVLGAAEVRELRPRLALAVLSSCASAGGRFLDAEGLQGLARAFLESGTRDVVATLWPVEDGAARAFALELHGSLAEGLPPSRAVRRARAALRAQGFGCADWAAFRLLGRD